MHSESGLPLLLLIAVGDIALAITIACLLALPINHFRHLFFASATYHYIALDSCDSISTSSPPHHPFIYLDETLALPPVKAYFNFKATPKDLFSTLQSSPPLYTGLSVRASSRPSNVYFPHLKVIQLLPTATTESPGSLFQILNNAGRPTLGQTSKQLVELERLHQFSYPLPRSFLLSFSPFTHACQATKPTATRINRLKPGTTLVRGNILSIARAPRHTLLSDKESSGEYVNDLLPFTNQLHLSVQILTCFRSPTQP